MAYDVQFLHFATHPFKLGRLIDQHFRETGRLYPKRNQAYLKWDLDYILYS